MLRLLKIIDLFLVSPHSSFCGLSLQSCQQALHFVRLHQPLPEQAGSTADADNKDSPMLLQQSKPDCRPGKTRRTIRSTNNRNSTDGILPASPGISTIHHDDGHGRTRGR